jgi:hypothetical protein
VRILVAAYTILAIAAGARATVQLATKAGEAPVAYALTAAAALVYLVLAIALRGGPRLRRLAAVAATLELVGVLSVGTAELVGIADWPDETVWSGYGAGYGWAPLLLPVATLIVLTRALHPPWMMSRR